MTPEQALNNVKAVLARSNIAGLSEAQVLFQSLAVLAQLVESTGSQKAPVEGGSEE